MRNEDEADEAGVLEWAGEVEGTAAGAEGTAVGAEGLGAVLVVGSVCVKGVSDGYGLFLPEETGDDGEGGSGIVRTERREPQSCDHFLAEFCGDCGRELRFNFPCQLHKIRKYF